MRVPARCPSVGDPAKELEGYEEGAASYVGATTGSVHLQDMGWTESISSLTFGTTGQARRIEAVRLALQGQPLPGGIEYDVHVQGRGWVDGARDGRDAGTTGQARRVEAVRVRLTGEMKTSGEFSVWYRVHSQDYGWLGWAKDGAEAGSCGLSKRAEAAEVRVLPKGQRPDGYDASKAACVSG